MSGGIYTDRGCDPLCFPGLSGSFRDPSCMECLHGKMRGIQFKRCIFYRVWRNDSGDRSYGILASQSQYHSPDPWK